jgi:hypothetical protein
VIDELAASLVSLLLRYFRKGVAIDASGGRVHASNTDLLLLHWSISREVQSLVEYARLNSHEMQSVLGCRVVTDTAIRGRIMAAETALAQTIHANPALYIFEAPFRSFDNGPNRVLGWTLRLASQLARRFRSMLPDEATYFERTAEMLASVRHLERVLPMTNDALLQMPNADDVRAARSSRIRLYRLAADAYDAMRALERREESAVADLLRTALVGPMERWRQFELALMLAMADAVASRIGIRPILRELRPGPSDMLIHIGPYGVRWQRPGPTYEPPMLEYWEGRSKGILSEYGLPSGYDRPDVVLYEVASGKTLAVGEAKYFESDDWRDRLRDAVSQVVTYARGYEGAQGDTDAIIGRSIIALWAIDGQAPRVTLRTPFVATFADFRFGLDVWAGRVLDGSRSAPPFAGSGTSSSASIVKAVGGKIE